MSWEPHLTVATVVEQGGKFLFVEEFAGGKQVINQPAGHVEDGENFIEAAIRETQEETGWQVEPDYLIGAYRWKHPDNGETFFRFTLHAKAIKHDSQQPLDDGIIQTLWLDKNELLTKQSQLRSPMVLLSIDDYLANKRYPLDMFVDL